MNFFATEESRTPFVEPILRGGEILRFRHTTLTLILSRQGRGNDKVRGLLRDFRPRNDKGGILTVLEKGKAWQRHTWHLFQKHVIYQPRFAYSDR